MRHKAAHTSSAIVVGCCQLSLSIFLSAYCKSKGQNEALGPTQNGSWTIILFIVLKDIRSIGLFLPLLFIDSALVIACLFISVRRHRLSRIRQTFIFFDYQTALIQSTQIVLHLGTWCSCGFPENRTGIRSINLKSQSNWNHTPWVIKKINNLTSQIEH